MKLSEFDISIHDNLADVEMIWRDAEKNLACYTFQSFEWLRCWFEAAQQHRDIQLRIVLVKGQDAAPLLMLPLCIRRQYGVRILSFMAHDVSDYQAPLISPRWAQVCPPDRFEAFFRAEVLPRLSGFDLFSFRWMPETVQGIANPLCGLAGVQPGLKARSAQLPGRWDAYLNKRRRKIHLDTARQLKRLGELGEVNIERVTDPAGVRAVVETMLAQKAHRFPLKPGENQQARLDFNRAFYAGIGEMRSTAGEGHVTCLKVQGNIVATHVGVMHPSRFYYIMAGFDARNWSKYSPGRILMEHLIRECIDSNIPLFDLTIGDEGYKRDWADTALDLFDVIEGTTLLGKTLCSARATARTLRATLRNTLQRRA